MLVKDKMTYRPIMSPPRSFQAFYVVYIMGLSINWGSGILVKMSMLDPSDTYPDTCLDTYLDTYPDRYHHKVLFTQSPVLRNIPKTCTETYAETCPNSFFVDRDLAGNTHIGTVLSRLQQPKDLQFVGGFQLDMLNYYLQPCKNHATLVIGESSAPNKSFVVILGLYLQHQKLRCNHELNILVTVTDKIAYRPIMSPPRSFQAVL